MTLAVHVSPAEVLPGEETLVVIETKNVGAVTLHGVSISEDLPAALSPDSATAASGAVTLAPGQTVTTSFWVRVSDGVAPGVDALVISVNASATEGATSTASATITVLDEALDSIFGDNTAVTP